VRDHASRYEPPGEQVAVLPPLAEHEAPTPFGERGHDVVADEGGAVGVLDEETEYLLGRRLRSCVEREAGLADVELE